ncbi:hypothetical protein LTR28_006162, partial [Elasticomyces elasticus]
AKRATREWKFPSLTLPADNPNRRTQDWTFPKTVITHDEPPAPANDQGFSLPPPGPSLATAFRPSLTHTVTELVTNRDIEEYRHPEHARQPTLTEPSTRESVTSMIDLDIEVDPVTPSNIRRPSIANSIASHSGSMRADSTSGNPFDLEEEEMEPAVEGLAGRAADHVELAEVVDREDPVADEAAGAAAGGAGKCSRTPESELPVDWLALRERVVVATEDSVGATREQGCPPCRVHPKAPGPVRTKMLLRTGPGSGLRSERIPLSGLLNTSPRDQPRYSQMAIDRDASWLSQVEHPSRCGGVSSWERAGRGMALEGVGAVGLAMNRAADLPLVWLEPSIVVSSPAWTSRGLALEGVGAVGLGMYRAADLPLVWLRPTVDEPRVGWATGAYRRRGRSKTGRTALFSWRGRVA